MNKLKILYLTLLLVLIITPCFASNNDFAVTITDKVKVYTFKDTNSIVLKVLPIGHLVKILTNSEEKVNINDKIGVWILIDTRYNDQFSDGTIKGWTQNFYIANKKDFKKVNKFGVYKVNDSVGDYALDINFYKDGTFKQKLYGEDEGKYIEGDIYQKDNVVCIEGKWTDGQDYYDFFYFDDEGNLFSIYTDPDGNHIQVKRLDTPTVSSNAYTLTGDNVNVRAEAATNGAVLVKLSKGAKVTLLKRSEVGLTVGDKKGYWAFIDTGIAKKDGEGTIKGWVFDYYLKEDK